MSNFFFQLKKDFAYFLCMLILRKEGRREGGRREKRKGEKDKEKKVEKSVFEREEKIIERRR
jgi:hypothetical protein